jgi:exodeoxyribonuclease V alpha subunit
MSYAVSIHKSQDSEYPAIVIPVTTQRYAMLEWKLPYAGITRGRSLVVVLGKSRPWPLPPGACGNGSGGHS